MIQAEKIITIPTITALIPFQAKATLPAFPAANIILKPAIIMKMAPITIEYLNNILIMFWINETISHPVHILGLSLVPQGTNPAAKDKLGIVKQINNANQVFFLNILFFYF